MPDTDVQNQARKWLASKQADEFLKQISKSLLNKARILNLPSTYVGLDDWEDDETADKEIRSRLILFLLENQNLFQFSDNKTDYPQFYRRIYFKFLQDWRDKSRHRDQDKLRYLYRQTQHTLREAQKKDGSFFVNVIRSSSVYSRYSIQAENVPSPSFSLELFQAIPYPHEIAPADYSGISTFHYIKILARYFWIQVSAFQNGRSIWILIRDFVAWIGHHVDFNEDMPIMVPMDEERQRPLIHTNTVFPMTVDETQIKLLAQRFVRSLSDIEKIAVYQHDVLELTLAQIARNLNFSRPSSVSYHLKNYENKLKRFINSIHPELASNEWTPETRIIFFDHLHLFLKNFVSMP